MTDIRKSTFDFLLAELRRARVSAGLNQEDFGKLLNFSSSQISAVEMGQRPLTRGYLRHADEVLGTGGLLERLLDLFLKSSAPPWLGPWVSTEADAKELRTYQPMLVPGLLQTAGYARAVLRAGLYSEEEVEKQVAARLERQSILTGDDPALSGVDMQPSGCIWFRQPNGCMFWNGGRWTRYSRRWPIPAAAGCSTA